MYLANGRICYEASSSKEAPCKKAVLISHVLIIHPRWATTAATRRCDHLEAVDAKTARLLPASPHIPAQLAGLDFPNTILHFPSNDKTAGQTLCAVLAGTASKLEDP